MSGTYWKGGETYHIIQAMKATGNQPGVIAQWKEAVSVWAQMNRTDPNAAAVNSWLPLWQPRPFYTADELAPLWPALGIVTGFTNRWPNVVKSARRLENELDFHCLPRLRDYEKGWRNFFIVERIHYWKRDAHENDIRREMNHAFG
jgi:hypothetical protein